MSTIDLNIETICKLRKRQQLFTMPSFRATVVSPYPTYTEEQLNMRRKVEILQYANNRLSTRTNNLTKKERYAQVISGKYQSKSYTTTYTETARYVYDPVTKTNQVVIDRTPVYSNPECSLDESIPTPTSSSDVPGPIINLYKDNNVPLYNYANTNSNNNIYAITDFVDTDLWKQSFIAENTIAENTIKTIDVDTFETTASDTTLASIYITDKISDSRYIFDFQIPVGFYFYGKYKGTNPVTLTNIQLTIPSDGFNPQVIFTDNPLQTNRIVTFHTDNTNVSSMSFNVPNEGQDFSGSLYAGMLKITNLELFTEPGYIYDLSIIADVILTQDAPKIFSANYDFYYGVSYNMTESNKKVENGCTINTNFSTNPLLPIQFMNAM